MSAPQAISVLCVDDNEMVAAAIERFIRREASMRWLGIVLDGARAFDTINELQPDIVLMDIDMPGIDTFGIVERLAQRAPQVRVIMFSGHVNRDFIDRALDSGAWGYISKNDDIPRVIEGIHQVARGEIALSKEVIAVQRSVPQV